MKVWLFGDSILGGTALRSLAKRLPPGARFLLRPPELMSRWSGLDVRRGGESNVSNKPGKCAALILRMVKRGQIVPGDTIVLLDVGEHSCDPTLHEDHWRHLVEAAMSAPGVRVLVCGGFDGGAMGRAFCRYDHPFGGRTMNQAISAAARGVQFLPMSRPMGRFSARMFCRGRTGYLFDEIHPDAWANLYLCRVILEALGADVTDRRKPLRKVVDRLRDRLTPPEMMVRHWKRLRARSRREARDLVRLAMTL